MQRVAGVSVNILTTLVTTILQVGSRKEVLAQYQPRLTMIIIYDNYPFKKGLVAKNGFSCIIRGTDETILFDTGGDGDVLLSNLKVLNVNPKEIDSIVISHEHNDHTGGLLSVLEVNNKVTVFIPDGFSDHSLTRQISTSGARTTIVKQPTRICRGVYSTGPMQGRGLYEQSLIINTEPGLILIVGCAHPGITNIIDTSMILFKKRVRFVYGGFHLKSASQDRINQILVKFISYGVKGVGGSHCTGARAMQLFRATYGRNYLQMGVGRILLFR